MPNANVKGEELHAQPRLPHTNIASPTSHDLSTIATDETHTEAVSDVAISL